MMHNIAGKRMQRNTAHRAALRKNFTVSILMHERVGKRKDLASVRRAVALLQDKTAVAKLFDEIGPRFANRQGGYTRIMRLSGYRPGDGGTRAIIELVDNKVLERKLKAAEADAAEQDTAQTDAPQKASGKQAGKGKEANAGRAPAKS
jgi:large subunit ribosomal protein L17